MIIGPELRKEGKHLRAWHVVDAHDSFLADIVHADTAGQAKIKSWMFTEEGLDFIDLRARREPKLDNVEELTPRAIHDAGYLVQCNVCGEFVGDAWDSDETILVADKVYHKGCCRYDPNDPTLNMTMEEMRQSVDEFDKAAELAEEEM